MDYLFNSESKLELLKKLSIWSPQEKNIKQDESPPIIAIVAAKLKLYSHLCQLLNHWNLIILNSPVCKAFCKVF